MIVLLHGFWGQPKDWNAVLSRLPLGAEVWIPDLYEAGPLAPLHHLREWTENFLNQLEMRAGSTPVTLIGYSMGARLALNALVTQPARFTRALLLSVNPLLPKEAYDGREEWEREWKEKFLKLDWPELERVWSDQPVFTGTGASERRRSPALRETLGQSLENWSIRHHLFESDDVRNLPASVEWAFGELDEKYVSVARDLVVQGRKHIVAGAGHRILTDAPEMISDWITSENRRQHSAAMASEVLAAADDTSANTSI